MMRAWLSAALLAGLALGACAGGADEAVVTGTVLDAASGEPIAEARVEGPGGAHTTTDRHGRFELRLAAGTSGELRAAASAERSARVVLRPLEAGRLEVVLRASTGR